MATVESTGVSRPPPYRSHTRAHCADDGLWEWNDPPRVCNRGYMAKYAPGVVNGGRWTPADPVDVSQVMKQPTCTPRAEDYQKKYVELMDKVAMRYPHPSKPRERMGSIGGSWRHVKEVLSNGGNRVIFVDGLVRLYDDHPSSAPNPLNRLKYKALLSTPLYAPNQRESETYKQSMIMQDEMKAYKPWLPQAAPAQSATKHKGFYSVRKY